MSGLKLNTITLDKESWDNVPPIVFKTLSFLNSNLGIFKKWADRTDERFEETSDRHDQLKNHLGETDAALQATQDELQQLSDEVHTLVKQSDKEFHTFTSCIKQQLEATLVFFERFVHAFNFENNPEPSHEEFVMSGDAPHGDELDMLMRLCEHFNGHLDRIDQGFTVWGLWRLSLEDRNTAILDKVEELRNMSEKTRERLLCWREILKENSYDVDSLSDRLRLIQDEVQDIKSEQVKRLDVDEMVGAAAQELKGFIEVNASTINDIQLSAARHVASVNSSFSETEKATKDQLETQYNTFKQMFEREVTPINAYLNTMHIKADVMRVELDEVSLQVPRLHANIKNVSAELHRSETAAREKAVSIKNHIEEVSNASSKRFERCDMERSMLADDFQNFCHDLNDSMASLRGLQESTSQSLNSVRHGDLSHLSQEVTTLEQKIAKWVHCAPLPAKVSEARLYALEARMADEMESRLELQDVIRESLPPSRQRAPPSRQRVFTPRLSPAKELPALVAGGPQVSVASKKNAGRDSLNTAGSNISARGCFDFEGD